ncbi:hypothetical protein MAHJHV47_45250 [Mycobacterium avium subsp. hominissuis]
MGITCAPADGWDPFPEFINGLRSAGAQVMPIHVYRWKPTPAGGRRGEGDRVELPPRHRGDELVEFSAGRCRLQR